MRKTDLDKIVTEEKTVSGTSMWVRATCIFLTVFMVGFIGAGLRVYSVYKTISKDPKAAFKKDASQNGTSITAADGTQYASKEDDIVNILLLGIDSDAERKRQYMGFRSDVVIVCSLNMTEHTMTLLTIPRDTYVEMDELDAEGAVKRTFYSKITEAYAYGGGPYAYGAENAVASVERFLTCTTEDGEEVPVKIDYYASIDMDGFPKLADAIGGVEVTLTESYRSYHAGDTITITRSNADDFVRNRNNGGYGDEGRNERQQLFLVGFLRKLKGMDVTSTVMSMYDDVMEYVRTDMNLEEIIALASFMQGISIDDEASFSRMRLPATEQTLNGISYLMADEEAKYEFVIEHFYHKQ